MLLLNYRWQHSHQGRQNIQRFSIEKLSEISENDLPNVRNLVPIPCKLGNLVLPHIDKVYEPSHLSPGFYKQNNNCLYLSLCNMVCANQIIELSKYGHLNMEQLGMASENISSMHHCGKKCLHLMQLLSL